MTNNVTDPYLKVAHAIIEALQTLTDIFPDPDSVTINRSQVSEGADYFFLLSPDAFSDSRFDNRDDIRQWITKGELAVRFAEYNSRTENFLLARGAIYNKLKQPFALKNIGLKPPVLVNGGELRQDIPGLNPNWIVQPITVTVNQIVANAK